LEARGRHEFFPFSLFQNALFPLHSSHHQQSPEFFSHHELFPTNKVPNFPFPITLFPMHFSHLRQNPELTFPENSKEFFSENSKEIYPRAFLVSL